MTDIMVDVTITSTDPLIAEYKSSTNGVSSDGSIEVPPGEIATITFSPVQTNPPIPGWVFQSPWVTVVAVPPAPAPGPTAGSIQSSSAVVVNDDDTNKSEQDYQYEYTLYTTLGQLDPRIINKSGTT